MAYDPIAQRYARAAFESAKAAGKQDELLEQLSAIARLCESHAELRRLVNNPDVDPPDKVALFKRLLGGDWSELLAAFLRMVIERGRSEFLPQIAEAFLAEVDAERGRLRVTVRSPHPLPEEALARFKTLLQRREGKQVLLETERAPELVAGVQLVMGNRVIDGSVQRQLAELRQRLSSVSVLEKVE